MPRRSRHAILTDNNDDDNDETQSPLSSRRRVSSYQSDSEDNNDDDNSDQEKEPQGDDVTLSLTQQPPELSQPMPAVRQNERVNLHSMGRENRQKAVTDLSRLILFKALAGAPIDRLKCAKETGINNSKITSAAFHQVSTRLQDVFGFELCRAPTYMEKRKSFPKKFKDRMFVINKVDDDETGNHSKAIHSVHDNGAVEKGFLMVVLAFVYCKGSLYEGVRWITDADLYNLLHELDESLPSKPPSLTGKRSTGVAVGSNGGASPNPDVLLDKFVKLDYLLEAKSGNKTDSQRGEKDEMMYSMGPRAALEIGRKQIVYFCAEILDEEADPTMLAEIEEDQEDDDGDATQTQTQTQIEP